MTNLKNITATTAVALAALAVTQGAMAEKSNDDSGLYLKLGGHGSFLSDSEINATVGGEIGDLRYEEGGGGTVAWGYQYTDSIRTELEFGASFNEADGFVNGAATSFDDNYMKAYTGMVNLFFDLTNGTSWVPYIGAGAGYARLDIDNLDDDVFAYQGMVGISYAVSEDVDLMLGYKYFTTEDAEFTHATLGTVTADYETHNVELGVRFLF